MRRQGRFLDRKHRKACFDLPLDFLCSFCRLGCYSFALALPILLICIQEQVKDRLVCATRALTRPSMQVCNSKHISSRALGHNHQYPCVSGLCKSTTTQVSTAPTDKWRNITGSVGRLTVSPLSVYEGSAGVPPAHRVGVVVVVGHGKGNSGASVDRFREARLVRRSTDPLAETGPLCTGNSRQRRCFG
jgi:hypothetical protein